MINESMFVCFFFNHREIALCGLAIFLCEELKHQRMESPIKPFIVFIVECLQVSLHDQYMNSEMRQTKNFSPNKGSI